MIDYRTLSSKKEIQPSGFDEKIADLFMPTYIGGRSARGSVEVTEEYVARPDLISLAVYGDDRHADIICKYNGISNPFELNVGMILFIPDTSDISFMFDTEPKTSVLANSETKIMNNEKSFHKRLDEKRSPNQMVEGETNYFVDEMHNIIVY